MKSEARPVAAINEFDLAFVVDTTGSMGGLIEAAQRQMIETVDRLAAAIDANMQLGLVEYRDHPPQDNLVYRVYPLTSDLQHAKKNINKLRAGGGGDEAEAVLAGIVAASQELSWRKHARRMAVLIGDAPPHGVGCPGDAFPRGCPSGETMESASAKAEEAGVTMYAVGLRPGCAAAFARLAGLTGGRFFPAADAGAAMTEIQSVLKAEFGQLDFDRQVYQAWLETTRPSADDLADRLQTTPPRVASAVCRLRSRGLLVDSGVENGA
jgi:Mg-chelatase subunit ChlD